ncbi:hypothetical protein [Mycolicibacterium pyrenivorans]|uniref:hypothetical protein n=1 Tax=Mycolicibacterium pyrenivorans TaxID=187102 RepID=UPI0021F2E5CB|nr:hypothetical protein [Mycolicibacterium pyrenivorans]MCV7149933.1 hypothetical protein [Mycolicibacterium pyrenivorans]
MIRLPYVFLGPAVVFAGLSVAPTAAADCTSSGGTTICAQGESRGANTGSGPSGSGPYVPYPCDYDWYCNDTYGWDWDVNLDWDPGPGIGAPGTPGNRPNVGGGGGRGGRR